MNRTKEKRGKSEKCRNIKQNPGIRGDFYEVDSGGY